MNQPTEATEEQVKAWMLARLGECMKITPHGAVSFTLKADNFAPSPRVQAVCYNSYLGHSDESASVEGAITNFRKKAGQHTPEELAVIKRAEAKALLAEAEKLESATI